MDKPGSIISRDELFEELWDDVAFVEENTLSVNVTRLKAKLEELGFPKAIKVRRGAGYYLDMTIICSASDTLDLAATNSLIIGEKGKVEDGK
jgi:DNA-binding winged helix-turn-helix (wHTH) protein